MRRSSARKHRARTTQSTSKHSSLAPNNSFGQMRAEVADRRSLPSIASKILTSAPSLLRCTQFLVRSLFELGCGYCSDCLDNHGNRRHLLAIMIIKASLNAFEVVHAQIRSNPHLLITTPPNRHRRTLYAIPHLLYIKKNSPTKTRTGTTSPLDTIHPSTLAPNDAIFALNT